MNLGLRQSLLNDNNIDKIYFDNNLVFFVDGEWNIGYKKHSYTTTTWHDLSLNKRINSSLYNSSQINWTDKSCHFDESTFNNRFIFQSNILSQLPSKFTIELVVKMNIDRDVGGWFLSNRVNVYDSHINCSSYWVTNYAMPQLYINNSLMQSDLFLINSSLADMNIHMLYSTYDGTTFKAYKDGILVHTATGINQSYLNQTFDNGQPLVIGGDGQYSVSKLNADIFSIRLRNNALNLNDINMLYKLDKLRFS